MRFVLLDRIDRIESGRSAEGHKNIRFDEPYFDDHFPGYPVVPGVLIVESMAQLGGRLLERTAIDRRGAPVLPMLAKIDQARFIRPVRPGDRLDLRVEVVGLTDDMARMSGVAQVGGQRVATATVMYVMVDSGAGSTMLDEAQREKLAQWSEKTWALLTGPA